MQENLFEQERLLAQYELREKVLNQRLEELTDFVENASVPLHWVDSQGIILWANKAELDYLGYSKDEYIGQPIINYHADREVINDILQRLADNETLRNYHARLRCKNGDIKHVLINSNVLRKDGEFIHTRCFSRDITALKEEEKKREDLLIELEQSEARLKMAMKSTKMGTWDYNPISGELNWSDECKNIYGLSSGIVLDFKIFSDSIYPDDKDYVLQEIKKSMDPSGDGDYDISYRISRFDDQSIRWIRAQGKVYFNFQQQVERFIGTVVDTTIVKLAQEKIEKSEKLFKSIALNIPKSHIIVIDKDHRFVTTEGDSKGKLGYNSRDYEGKDPLEFAPQDRYEVSKPLYDRVLSGEKFSIERKAQTGEDYVVHFVPLKNEDGEVYAGLIIALDITEIKLAEEQSAKLAAIVASSDDAIISKTLDGIITSWNNSAERMFGYTSDEIIGQSILKIIPEDRQDEEIQILSRLKKGERLHHFETKRLTKGQKLLDISLSNSPTKDSQGNIIGISKIARDITEKKQSELLLKESEEHLRLALTAADLGTFDLNLVDNTMEWDSRCRELFGISHNLPVSYSHDFLEGLHEDDRERVSKIIDKLFDKSSIDDNYDVEYRTVAFNDKKLRWVRAMGKVFFHDNKPVRFAGVVLDISDRKHAELKKNDFVAMVSHELKTPLTTVNSYVQLLLAKAKKENNTFEINALSRTQYQTNKMIAMIRDFLSLARLEEGGLQLRFEKFVLQSLIKEIITDPQFLLSSHTIEFKEGGEILVNADRDKIGQVLINLLSNAIKYSPGGGTITIGYEIKNGKVKVYVKDEGVGIKAKDQKRLFDRFYRVEDEKIKTVSGFGIGLYLVSEILRYHNNEIKVESEAGKGSTFFFSLDVV
ncbi:MAG: PAS domain S-box protein, partial [Pyrinomonadaceae bacterium]|nr:PAS domain S-box protein [Sphingobacteriaceae bacterium]